MKRIFLHVIARCEKPWVSWPGQRNHSVEWTSRHGIPLLLACSVENVGPQPADPPMGWLAQKIETFHRCEKSHLQRWMSCPLRWATTQRYFPSWIHRQSLPDNSVVTSSKCDSIILMWQLVYCSMQKQPIYDCNEKEYESCWYSSGCCVDFRWSWHVVAADLTARDTT